MYVTLVLFTGNREYSLGMSEESIIDSANRIIILHFSVYCSISVKNLQFLRQFGKFAANAWAIPCSHTTLNIFVGAYVT